MTNNEIKPIFLCGMMGSGKSTTGKILADKLQLSFLDLDDLIEEKAGMSIPEIFNKKGESGFRKIEKEVLMQVSEESAKVIALGGGALQNQKIVDHLKLKGLLIFLEAPLSVLFNRVKSNSIRPILQHKNESEIKNRLHQLLAERMRYYQQSNITVNAGIDDPCLVADSIIKKISMHES
jgi:shikimate kinase